MAAIGSRRSALLIATLAALSGCLQTGQPVVAERSPAPELAAVKTTRPSPQGTRAPALPREYVVKRGDTLYSIAWRYGFDHLALARANGLDRPFLINPGQRLRLASAPAKVARRAPVPRPPRPAAPPSAQSAAPVLDRWVWPLEQAPQREFGGDSPGMDFLVARGERVTVRAAGAGRVVYAGVGLGSFEHLIIVRHSDVLLSAYGFNGNASVREQQAVKAGQKLADITASGRTSQKLHFELRREGEPVDPRSVLD